MMFLDKLLLIILIYTTLFASDLIAKKEYQKQYIKNNIKITDIHSTPKYTALIETNIKIGNKRHLGRIGALLPVLQNNVSLIHASLFVMKDSKSAFENNIGLGYRRIIKNNCIIGGYGFWDIRRSINKKNYIHQVNLGAEIFFDNIELRLNGYLPVSNDVVLNRLYTSIDSRYYPSVNQTVQSQKNLENHEVLLTGYDIDVGGSILGLSKLNAYVAYYHFFKTNISQIGYRIRTEYAVLDWMSIGGEISYDNKRKWYNYFDIKVQYRFGKKNNFKKLTKLEQKMTLLPVRDVDIISKVQKKEVLVHQDNEDGIIPVIVIATVEQLHNKKIRISGDTVIYIYYTNVRVKFNHICKQELQNVIVVNSNGDWNKLVRGSEIDHKVGVRLSQLIQDNKIMLLNIKTSNKNMKRYIDNEISKALSGIGYLFDQNGKIIPKQRPRKIKKPNQTILDEKSNNDDNEHLQNDIPMPKSKICEILTEHLTNKPSRSELVERGLIIDVDTDQELNNNTSSQNEELPAKSQIRETLNHYLTNKPSRSELVEQGIIIDIDVSSQNELLPAKSQIREILNDHLTNV